MVSGFEIENNLRRVFKRCVKCPPGAPSCPPCAADETCSLQAESCNACASTTCVKVGSLPGQSAPSSGPPAGAIAGGTIAGVVAIVAITYLVWRFCIRNRRKAWDDQAWTDAKIEKRHPNPHASNDRQSTHTVASMTSTVLTRASNVIQIAYIPGVTNRSPPNSPALLAPPVPPIPSAVGSVASSPRFAQDAHFFMPGDLRDSMASDLTEPQRMSMTPSLTPSLARASVATTIYRDNAVISAAPAQQALRVKPGEISVKSGTNTPGSTSGNSVASPAVPQMPKHIATQNSSIVARTLTPRPVEIRKAGSGNNVPTLANLAKKSTRSTPIKPATPAFEGKEVVSSPAAVTNDSRPLATPALVPKPSFGIVDIGRTSTISAILPAEGPLRGEKSPAGSAHGHNTSSELNAMIEEALNRAVRTESPRPSPSKQPSVDSGPFSDANELKENLL